MNTYFPPMQAGFPGFGSPSSSIEQYRNQNMPNGSPVQPTAGQMPQVGPSQAAFGPPGFGMPMGMNMGMGGFNGYNNLGGGMQGMGYMQQEQAVNARRGRGGQPSHGPQGTRFA
jgi:protein JSN1